MRSCLAILTYRRLYALRTMMQGVEEHCPQYQCAIMEDCGQRDATADYLCQGRVPTPVPELDAMQHTVGDDLTAARYLNAQVYLGGRNRGVAANSNRALKWFMDGNCDHLCLCNDDLVVKGDFLKFYAQGHQDLGVGLCCFCDFAKASPAISGPPETYKWTTYRQRGYGVKFLPRYTGIMLSITRELVEKVGYFDAEFGKFGEEHSDYTIRCRLAGGIQCEGQDMKCLDLEHDLLGHQDVETSMTGPARKQADVEANMVMQRVAWEYRNRHYYRPYRLFYPAMAGGYAGSGIPCRQLEQIGYKLAASLV